MANNKVAFDQKQTIKDEEWDDEKQSWLTWESNSQEGHGSQFS